MRVEDVMTRGVAFCNPGTNAAAAAEIMWAQDCGFLPVLEDSGRVAGIVTDRDLFIALGTQNRNASELTVGEVMHREPSICAPDDDVRNAMRAMAEHGVYRLPVVDESGALRGVLSMDDVVLQLHPEHDDAFNGDVIRTLKAIIENRAASLG
jgi:CBS domain-containing protein